MSKIDEAIELVKDHQKGGIVSYGMQVFYDEILEALQQAKKDREDALRLANQSTGKHHPGDLKIILDNVRNQTTKRMKQQAIGLLINEGVNIDELSFEKGYAYPLIAKEPDGTMHFFLEDESGILFYDGWDKGNDCEIDVRQN